MSTPFLDGFKLSLDDEHESENIIEDGLSSIGVLSTMAQDCSNLAAAFQDGSAPNNQMINQVVYAASVLSGLAVNVSDILVAIEINRGQSRE